MNVCSTFPVLAKPSGITLEQHTAHVITEGEALIGVFQQEKYQERVHKNLNDRIKLVCQFHDRGKKEIHWQKACQKDYAAYRKNPVCFVAENIRKAGVRHELFSAREATQNKMPLPLVAAIAAHHGKLNVGYEQRWQSFPDIWKEMKMRGVLRKVVKEGTPKVVNRSEIKVATSKQSKMTKQQIVRSKAVYYGIGQYLKCSFDKYIDNYELDLIPESDLQ